MKSKANFILKKLNKQGLLNDTEMKLYKQAIINKSGAVQNIILWLFIWLLLVIFPLILTRFEQIYQTERYSRAVNKKRICQAFRNSFIPGFLLALSAILFLLIDIPGRLLIEHKFIMVLFHLVITGLLLQWPIYRFEKGINSKGDFYTFLKGKLVISLIKYSKFVTFVFTYALIHYMIYFYPLWPIMRPFGITFGFIAMFSAFYILYEALLPKLLFFKYYDDLPVRTYTYKNELLPFKTVILIGKLRKVLSIILLGNIEEKLNETELNILLEWQKISIEQRNYLKELLLTINFVMLNAVYIALKPLGALNFFYSGPTFIQLIGITGFAAAYFGVCLNIKHNMIFEADKLIAQRIGSDKFVEVLQKVGKINMIPEKNRDYNINIEYLPSFAERAAYIYEEEGLYITPFLRPCNDLICALWRARLDIEWRLGEKEALHICSLDYTDSGDKNIINHNNMDILEQIPEIILDIAIKHSLYGSYILINKTKLKILECVHKMALLNSKSEIPCNKVCNLCGKSMLAEIDGDKVSWVASERGCEIVLNKKND